MAIFKKKTGGTKVGNLLRKVGSVASNIIKPKNVPTFGQVLDKSVKAVQTSQAAKNAPFIGPVLPKNSQQQYQMPIGPQLPTSNVQSLNTSGRQTAPKSSNKQYGPYLPSGSGSNSSRVVIGGGSSGSVSAARSTSAPSSVYGGVSTGPTATSKSGGSLNAPVGGAVIGANDFNYNLTPQQIAEQEARDRLIRDRDKESSQEVDENKIRRDTMRLFQAEIDATNEIMAEKLRQARLAGQSRLGSTRAENFNAGAVDSSFGNAAMQRTVADNTSMENTILAEKVQAIAQIENQARTLGQKFYQDRKAAKEAGLTDYLEAIKGQGTAKEAISTDIAMSIFNNGVTVDEIEPAQLTKIAKNAGVTTQQIKNSYASVLKAMEKEAEAGNLLASNLVSGKSGFGGTASEGAKALALQIRNGQATLANVPSDMRAEVAQALNELPNQQVIELDNIISTIDELANNPKLDNILGPTDQFVGGVFGEAATAKNLFKQLEGVLALEGRSKLKGSGAISDFEFGVLKDAQSALKRNLNATEFKKQLIKVRDVIENRKQAISSNYQQMEAPKSIEDYRSEFPGASDEELQALYDEEQGSFNQASSISSVDEALEKIARIESGGSYQALGPVLNSGQYKGQQAIGKYQVMEGNVPAWSKLALGYSVTPQQFYENPQIQDAVARDQFQRNYNKYGNWDDVASVWFTGQPVKKAGKVKDQLGTSAQEYVKRFNLA